MNRKICAFAGILIVASGIIMASTPVIMGGGGARIINFSTAGTINLTPGADRGTITYPLFTGTLNSTGEQVLFIITDASNGHFADFVGAAKSAVLADAADNATEIANFDEGAVIDGKGTWTFFNDPGNVTHYNATGGVERGSGNLNYSPLKRIMWDGRLITVNAPFIKWGNASGQQLLIDQGGCDPLIRSNPPSPFFVGGGPKDGADCTNETALDRYKGGQVVALDLVNKTVTMKLHKATFRPSTIPYYIVTDASKLPAAEFMGVIHSPRTENLGRAEDSKVVGNIFQFANGVRVNTGGPNRFQPGITEYPAGKGGQYTPMWHIIWLFYDCNGNGVFFNTSTNIAFGATPVAGSGIPGFDPSDPATFDPFGMDDKGVACQNVAINDTGNPDGFTYYGEEEQLLKKGLILWTDGPAGAPLSGTPGTVPGFSVPPLIVNCPVPVQVRI